MVRVLIVGPMPTPWSLSFRLTLALLALLLCCQCEGLKRFKPQSRERSSAESEKAQSDNKDGEKKSDSKNAKEKDEPKKGEEGDFRLIAVDNTPFFKRLRSGLRSSAKPSRYLDKGARVELLKEDQEKLFSQIRLDDGKKGWVPSRLVREQAPKDPASEESEATTASDQGEGETEMLPDLEAPEKPTLPNETESMGPLDDSELPQISVPDVDIRLPTGIPIPQPAVETPPPSTE